ncbi:MAG: hypothetical protein JXJ20_03495 [Anaerolineae bacterium]|nr:hypothetical protein [Anaerolineae bacterium]
MDGIFGVGLAEMLIVLLILFVVGGPENTAKWAREAGRWARKARRAWSQMMAEIESELGPEGKELLDTTRELNRSAYELRTMSGPKRLMSDTTRIVKDSLTVDWQDKAAQPTLPAKTETSSTGSAETGDGRYQAWLPPKDE